MSPFIQVFQYDTGEIGIEEIPTVSCNTLTDRHKHRHTHTDTQTDTQTHRHIVIILDFSPYMDQVSENSKMKSQDIMLPYCTVHCMYYVLEDEVQLYF